jgi:KDO2-lipid IV(A) lauroyltransferase
MKLRDVRRVRVRVLFWLTWNVARLLPYRVASNLLPVVGRIFAPFITRQNIIKANLAKAFPGKSPEWASQTALAVASNIGRLGAELIHFDHLEQHVTFTVSGKHHVNETRDRPAIFVGAHLGNWELVPLYLGKQGIELTIIHRAFGVEHMDKRFAAARQLTGAEYVEKRIGAISAMRAIKRGRSVALLVDQKVSSGIEVNFFGQPSIVTDLPARIALRFNVPIIPVDVERKGNEQFHINFGSPIVPTSGDVESTVADMTQLMISQIEFPIHRTPETWFCIKRRW